MSPEFELLVYLLTSARSLPDEPQMYGPIRLTEAASKVCTMLCRKEPENENYRKLQECIDSRKGKGLSEPEEFMEMLEEASALMVECLD